MCSLTMRRQQVLPGHVRCVAVPHRTTAVAASTAVARSAAAPHGHNIALPQHCTMITHQNQAARRGSNVNTNVSPAADSAAGDGTWAGPRRGEQRPLAPKQCSSGHCQPRAAMPKCVHSCSPSSPCNTPVPKKRLSSRQGSEQ